MSELVEIFREEVDVNLKEATRLALGLESGAPEREQTEALMRVFHTLKGAARAIGFEEEKTTAHLLEDVYHDLLEGRAEPQAALVDLSLDAVDLIRATVEARLTERPLPNLAPFQARVDAYRSGAPLDSAAAAADAPPLRTAHRRLRGGIPRLRRPTSRNPAHRRRRARPVSSASTAWT
jgi:chemotaxis protein histidine kinase CheA